jgi:ABC-type polysaccharide/polyol phosphate export permease
MWLFLTPVLYPLEAVPENLRRWYALNPMTGLVESFRRVLLDGEPPLPSALLSPAIGALVALAVGVWYFAATEKRFADVI